MQTLFRFRIHLTFLTFIALSASCVVGDEGDVELLDPTMLQEGDAEASDSTQPDDPAGLLIEAFVDATADGHAARFNPHRRNHGRAALDRVACLNGIARNRARRMAEGQCPGGAQICHFGGLGTAVTNNCPFRWTTIGENVGAGSTELSLWQAFLASAAHHANIDSANFNRFGVGAFRRTSDNQLFIAHVFARN